MKTHQFQQGRTLMLNKQFSKHSDFSSNIVSHDRRGMVLNYLLFICLYHINFYPQSVQNARKTAGLFRQHTTQQKLMFLSVSNSILCWFISSSLQATCPLYFCYLPSQLFASYAHFAWLLTLTCFRAHCFWRAITHSCCPEEKQCVMFFKALQQDNWSICQTLERSCILFHSS